tara:strand:- start:4946 stop:5173 length:228 start_codon:yes stop_codon:yes gene_type:complete
MAMPTLTLLLIGNGAYRLGLLKRFPYRTLNQNGPCLCGSGGKFSANHIIFRASPNKKLLIISYMGSNALDFFTGH